MRLALKFRAKAKQAKQFQVKLRQVHQVILAGMETGMGQNIGNACLKKKRKVNGKATLFYGDLIMGHSFGFIWIHLDVSESGAWHSVPQNSNLNWENHDSSAGLVRHFQFMMLG